MIEVRGLLDEEILSALPREETRWVRMVLEGPGGSPLSVGRLWKLMDDVWRDLGCDPHRLDHRVERFYAHPVWLLNGLFTERDPESLAHRRGFVEWLVRRRPRRVADFGGGFGALARMLGSALPDARVEIIEPHPHPVAVELAARRENVRYRAELTGVYDAMVATDVFEHVSDPLGLAVDTATFLRVGGTYLIANCFRPVVLCHLPQNFHFEWTWERVLERAGLRPREPVEYGRAFERVGSLDLAAARDVELRSRRIHRWLRPLPGRVRRVLTHRVLDHQLRRQG